MPDPLADTTPWTFGAEPQLRQVRCSPVNEGLASLIDDSLTLTLTRLQGIADVHYASSWPGRQPTHALEPGTDGTFTVAQLFAHRQWFRCIPRPCEAEFALGFDHPGRHALPPERLLYTTGNTMRLLAEIGVLG